jgi:5S rRNA maturation endonuclease (ribonuclease M5)
MNKYAEHIAEVARDLWGDENKRLSHGSELRFGSQGSKSVDTEKGTWYDHESQESGGFTDLCKQAYPEANGHLADFLESKFKIEKDPAFASQKRDQITVYDYIGDHGVLEYQVIRTDFSDGSKTFRQQRPDGKGGWIKNLKDVRRIPYNLPEVLHRKDRWVWVVEGEKCVEKLREIGILATTNNGGSGNWNEEHSQWLKDRKVIVVPDNDEAGQKHAAKVVNSLLSVAHEVRVLDLSKELPNKGDIVDWLDSGKTKEQLAALVRKTEKVEAELPDPGVIEQEPPPTFPILSLNDLQAMPPVQFLVDGLFTRHGFAVMYGQPGCGKTFVALDVALCVASGKDWHGRPVKQGAVLYIAGEGVGGLGKRTKAWVEHNYPSANNLPMYVLPTSVNFAAHSDVEKLTSTIHKLQEDHGVEFSLIVVDTVARALLGADENSATDIGKFVKACDRLKDEYGCALLGIHHSGKDATKGMRGSSALLGAVDTSVQVTKSELIVKMHVDKQKDAEPPDDLYFQMNSTEVGTIGGETSVYLTTAEGSEFKTEKSSLSDKQLKAMNCCRDALEGDGVINQGIARDSFMYWLENHGGMDGDDEKVKKRRRMAWLRALNSLIDSGNIVSFRAGKELRFKDETGAHDGF